MKKIIKFQAYTGTEFLTERECERYEARCRKADKVINRLDPTPELQKTVFENGGGFIQHDPQTFLKVRHDLLKLAMAECDHRWIGESLANPDVHASYAGRIISECCNERLNAAWYRISCVDKSFREWGQPYYVDHPQEAKQVCLNHFSAAFHEACRIAERLKL